MNSPKQKNSIFHERRKDLHSELRAIDVAKAPNRCLQSAEHTAMIKGDPRGLTGGKS
jgi:hypothetical protein